MILKAGKYYRCVVAEYCPVEELLNLIIPPTRDMDTSSSGERSYRGYAVSYNIARGWSQNWSVHRGEEYEEVPDEEVVILKMAGKIVDTPKDPP